jgi:APA family basic amino acid/polyamine antiporter
VRLRTLFRTKPLEQVLAETEGEATALRRALGPWDLVAIGIGCIIGVGIFVLPGVEAARLLLRGAGRSNHLSAA